LRLQNIRSPEDMCDVAAALVAWLRAPGQADVRRSFVAWWRRALNPRPTPKVEPPPIEALEDIQNIMLGRDEAWTQYYRDSGWQEGREEGWREGHPQGRQAGGAEFLTRQLELKFGGLGAAVRDRIAKADVDRLLTWSDRVLTAQHVEDVFD
jgi:hypothetical protein